MSHMIPLYIHIQSPFFSSHDMHHHKATNPLLSPKRLISIPIGQSSVPLACFITLPPAAQITNSPPVPIKGGPTSNHDVRGSSPASFQKENLARILWSTPNPIRQNTPLLPQYLRF